MRLILDRIGLIEQIRWRHLILAEQSRCPLGVTRSNIGGWHSEPNLHHIQKFAPVVSWLENRTGAEVTELWANINPPGASNSAHTHGGDTITAVVYIQTPDDGGDLCFANETRIRPIPGLVLFFDPRISHSVEINQSRHDRISLSANLKE